MSEHTLDVTVASTNWKRWLLLVLACSASVGFVGDVYVEHFKAAFDHTNDKEHRSNQILGTAHATNDFATPPQITNFDKNDDDTPSSCPSHYLATKQTNEFSPLLFERDNLVVCRTAKVGSTELRISSIAYEEQTTFASILNETIHDGLGPLEGRYHSLASITNETVFRQYLFGGEVHRIMLVRHPVLRILSGFKEIAQSQRFWQHHELNHVSKEDYKKPESFQQWILNADDPQTVHQSFAKLYHSNCDDASLETDLHNLWQHYAPPQHCRCGIADCQVQWHYHRLEDSPSLSSIFQPYLPEQYLAAASNKKSGQTVHTRRYQKSDYINERVLEILNEATRVEQEYFGYKPLTMKDLD